MTKIFSTKLDTKVLQLLDSFCRRYHVKKAHLLEDIMREGIQRRMEAFELAESICRGLQDEKEGNLYPAEEIDRLIFGKRKAS